jgi:copper chaperone CopZ
MESTTFTVPNISCGHCTHTVEMELGDLAGVSKVTADEQSLVVTFSWDPPAIWEQKQATLAEINYPVAV